MSPHIGAEAITPVISATGRIQGNSAIPVYVYTSIPSDRRGLGMAAQPVVFINDSDLVENGGQYKLQGRLTALPVIQMPVGSRAIGMPAIPVYDVTNKAWPPAFNPVVPTPPSSFPPITTGLILDLQADVLALGPLTTWADASGQHHDFTKGAGSSALNVQSVGGFNVVIPNGTDDWMVGSNFGDNLPSFTIFYVGVIPSNPNNPYGVLLAKMQDENTATGWDLDLNGVAYFAQQNNGNSYLDIGPHTVGVPPYDDQYHVVAWEITNNLSTGQIYVDGVALAQNVNGTSDLTNLSNNTPVTLWQTGDGGSGGGAFSPVPLRAVMMYAPALSPADRATMEAALKTKYGTP